MRGLPNGCDMCKPRVRPRWSQIRPVSGQVCNAGQCSGPGGLTYIPGSTCNDTGQCIVDGELSQCNVVTLYEGLCDVVQGCKNPADNSYEEPCYDGPAATANVGQCKSVSENVGRRFGLYRSGPTGIEVVAGDENCNGVANEELAFGCSGTEDVDGDGSGLPRIRSVYGPR